MPNLNTPIGKKSGPSRAVIYTLLGAVVIYAVFFLTQPDISTHKTVVHITRTASAVDANGFTPADYAAHFPRYAAKKQNPFAARVAQAHVTTPQDVLSSGKRGGWALTGINSVDGVTTALVENSATGESEFLKPGDTWNSLRVVSVTGEAVVLENALGQQTRLAFAVTDDTSPGTNGRAAGVPTVPALPPLPGQTLTITPMPIIGAQGITARGGQQGSSNQP